MADGFVHAPSTPAFSAEHAESCADGDVVDDALGILGRGFGFADAGLGVLWRGCTSSVRGRNGAGGE